VTDPVRPPSAPQDRRTADRRTGLRRAKAPKDGRDLVPIEPAVDHALPPPPRAKDDAATAFEAQRIGQDGVKRGLKGGQEVLDQARSTYLSSEYSGAADRRPRPGQVSKTKI
jgi:hypothetical protein